MARNIPLKAATGNLIGEYRRLRDSHKDAIKHNAARVVLGPSVIRVFKQGTKDALFDLLSNDTNIDRLEAVMGSKDFQSLFQCILERIDRTIKRFNSGNKRIHPGRKWGHAAKIANLFIREMTINSHYFNEDVVRRIEPFLFMPIDNLVMNRLRKIGIDVRFKGIKDIEKREDFQWFQNLFEESARKVGVPRVWFDDNWGDRQVDGKGGNLYNGTDK